MNKEDLVRQVAAATGFPNATCAAVFNAIRDVVADELADVRRSGDLDLRLNNFGHFWTFTRVPKKARNPQTGEIVMLPLRKVIRWRPSPAITFQMNPRREGHAPD